MNRIKEKMIEIINKQSDDSSFDEILQELSFMNMVSRGLEDSKNEKVISTGDLKKEIENW
jgi:hypothetical protein